MGITGSIGVTGLMVVGLATLGQEVSLQLEVK